MKYFINIFLTVLFIGNTVRSEATSSYWQSSHGLVKSASSKCSNNYSGAASGSWNYLESEIYVTTTILSTVYSIEVPINVTSLPDPRFSPQLVFFYEEDGRQKKINGEIYNLYEKNNWQTLKVKGIPKTVNKGRLLVSKQTQEESSIDFCIDEPFFSNENTKNQPALNYAIDNHVLTDRVLTYKNKKSNFLAFSKFKADVIRHCQLEIVKEPSRGPNLRMYADTLANTAYLYVETKDKAFGACLKQLISSFDIDLDAQLNTADNLDLGHAHLLKATSLVSMWLKNELTDSENTQLTKIAETIGSKIYSAFISNSIWWSADYAHNQNHAFISSLGMGCNQFGELISNDCENFVKKRISNIINKALPKDGSSIEGPSYWNYSMMWILSYLNSLSDTERTNLASNSTIFSQAINYRLHTLIPGLKGVIPYGDTDEKDYNEAGTVFLGLYKLSPEPDALKAANLVMKAKWPNVMLRWEDFGWSSDSDYGGFIINRPLFNHFNDQGILIWRNTNWNSPIQKDSTLIFFKAGPAQGNTLKELGVLSGGHNHPDQGHISIFSNGRWLLKDDGYSKLKLTSNHNSATFNGIGQSGEGSTWFASNRLRPDNNPHIETYKMDSSTFFAKANLESAYPKEAGIHLWSRIVAHQPKGPILIIDDVELVTPGNSVWYFHSEYDLRIERTNEICEGGNKIMDIVPINVDLRLQLEPDAKNKSLKLRSLNNRYLNNIYILYTSNIPCDAPMPSAEYRNGIYTITGSGYKIKVSKENGFLN